MRLSAQDRAVLGPANRGRPAARFGAALASTASAARATRPGCLEPKPGPAGAANELNKHESASCRYPRRRYRLTFHPTTARLRLQLTRPSGSLRAAGDLGCRLYRA